MGVPAFGHMLGAVVGKIDEVSQEQEMENKFRSGPGGSAFTENTPEVSRYQTKKKKEKKKRTPLGTYISNFGARKFGLIHSSLCTF